MADTIKTNLGPVTAYADAKAHGYTGTREEFGQLLANAGLNLKAAETAKADAEAAKQAAETAQQAAAENQKNAGTQAANAKASADTAAEQAAVAEESAADAANSATAAQESETNAGLSATAAANAEAAAKQAQNAAETAKADAETAKTAAGNSADAAANSAADAKKTLESIPADYSALSGKVDKNTSGISELKEDLVDVDTRLSESIIEISDGFFPLGEIVKNSYPNKGVITSYDGWDRTGFVKIPKQATTLIVNCEERGSSTNDFFDENKTYIGSFITDIGKSVIDIPNNAKYFMLSNTSSGLEAEYVNLTIIDNIYSKIRDLYGEKAYIVRKTTTYNPNTGQEGNNYPKGVYGDCSILFDVSNKNGKKIYIQGAMLGYVMQFSETPAPSTYVGGKTNINDKHADIMVLEGVKYLAVNVFGDGYNVSITSDESFVTKQYLDSEINSKGKYVAIGDSITQGTGSSTYENNYYWKLSSKIISSKLASDRVNLGSGGSGSLNIAAYCGAIDLSITQDITIPSSISPVNIELNRNVYNSGGGVGHCNPVYISGVKGNLSYSVDGYTFTREKEGNSKRVASGTAIITNACKESINAEIISIFVGTNDKTDINQSYIDESISNTIQLSKLSKNGKFVVVLPFVHSTNDIYRQKMLDAFGMRAFDSFKYFSEQAVYDAISEGLISDGSQSDWNSILTTDGTHPNDIGHQLLAERIFERIEELLF